MAASPDIMEPLLDEATSLLKALSHPARLMICCQLRGKEMSVGDIETTLGIKQPNLSRELAKLREEGLVETRRESKVIFYRLADETRVAPMVDAICSVMLSKPPLSEALETEQPANDVQPRFRPNRPGGYGVFARTN